MASAITGAVVVNTILRRPAMTRHAISFYEETQRATYDSHYSQSARYYQKEGRWIDHPFWQKRAQVQSKVQSPKSKVQGLKSRVQGLEDSAFRTPQLEDSALRNSQRVSHLRLAPRVTIEQRPVIEGPYVELREVVIAPPYPRGVRFLQDVCVPTLLRLAEAHRAGADVIAAYLHCSEGRS